MNYAQRLIQAWKRRQSRGRHSVLDVWAGETVMIHGHKFFKMPDGKLMPAISGGGAQGWVETLDTITADGTQISNTTNETIVCPDFNIPAYYMAPGRTLRIWAFGVCSNVVTTPGTIIFWVRWGGVAGTVLLETASAGIGLYTTATTNSIWSLMATIVCRSSGATGTFMSGGQVSIANVLSSQAVTNNTTIFGSWAHLMGSAGAPTVSGNAAVTVDTTAAKLLSVTAKFSVATSPTNLTCQQRVLEVLN